MKNKTWKAPMKFTIDGYPPVAFIGRTPFTVSDDAHKKALVKLGVFKLVGDSIRYSGRAFYKDDDGAIVDIDMNGKLTKDKAELKMSAKRIAEIEQEFE